MVATSRDRSIQGKKEAHHCYPCRSQDHLASSELEDRPGGARSREVTRARAVCIMCPFQSYWLSCPQIQINLFSPGEDLGTSATKASHTPQATQSRAAMEPVFTRDTAPGRRARHSARATGARFVAERNIELWRTQLFERWGSSVFLHYIQDAPLKQLDKLALESTAPSSYDQRASSASGDEDKFASRWSQVRWHHGGIFILCLPGFGPISGA